MPASLKTRHAIDLSSTEFREMKRTFTVDRAGIDKEARTVPLSFASEQPVERWFGREILDVTPGACDLARLRNGGAILVNHDWDDQVGVVIEASLDATTKMARCVAKFSRSTRGEEIFQDIRDGIRSLVSVGYIVRKMVLQSVEGDVETHRVTDWQPYEVSVVAVPADTSVGVGRSQTPEKTSNSPSRGNAATRTMPPTETPEKPVVVVNETEVRAASVTAERTRVKDITAAASHLAGRHPHHAEAFRALAAKCVETGDDVNVFNRSVLADILATKNTAAPGIRQDGAAATIGLNNKDRKRYSLLRAINLAAAGKPLDGLEAECSQELTRKLDRPAQGFFVPDEILLGERSKRTLQANTGADGGYTIESEILTQELVELLRNQTKVVGLGARVITGLVGNVAIPRQLTGATAYWVAEAVSLTQSSATFGQIWGKPRRLGTSVPYTKEFLAQTSLSAEAFVRDDSLAAIGVELDRVAINGAGGKEPLGILNLASGDRSTSVTFGAAPTWAKYVDFWTQVATNNAIIGNPAYLTTPASAAKAMTVQKFSTYGDPIWQDGKIGVYRADWSNQFPTSGTLNQVIYGDFSQMLFLEWAGYDVVVDPYSGKKEGTVEVTIQRLMDMVIRRGKSFSISADSGAQ